jgi:hypothetical protein
MHEIIIETNDKCKLFEMLKRSGIKLNAYAEMLLEHPLFTLPPSGKIYMTVEVAVHQLGFDQGASLPEIFEKAQILGYGLCPPGLAPFFRLTYVKQNEENDLTGKKHQAPIGSITIAAPPLSNDIRFPKGFYVRKINGALWLRGYVCDDLHIWSKDDVFLFLIDT